MTSKGELQVSIQNRIASVTFSHPSANSFPAELLQKLTDCLDSLSKNDDVSVILLRSAGEGAFCAGASFDELLAVQDLEEGNRFFSGFANVLNAMRRNSKLIVGRIHGKAVGGGVGLAAACDYAFGCDASEIKLSELAIGIGPFVIAPAVERKMGLNALTELTLNPGDWKSATWAKTHGLYAEVFSNSHLLDEAINLFCRRIAGYNPDAITQIKKSLWQGTDNWSTLLYDRAAISGSLVLSDYTRRALAEFKK
ncbi:MAG: enoyl-CoA hydratase/isomerase family protein [Flavobacterium sp.]|nr:enoyl-CoA hydratase/isomerase family protein [Flavobacterium sp.]